MGLAVSSPPTSPEGAGDHVEDAGRNAGTLAQLAECECGERRRRRRPCDHGAAGGERRPRLARDHGVREVPRRDHGDDADRLLGDNDALVAQVRRNDIAVGALALLGEPLDERAAIADLAPRFRHGLPLFGGHDDGEVLLVRHHQVVPLAEDLGALLGGLGAPGGEGPVRGLDRGAGLGGGERRHGTDHLAIRRIHHAGGPAGLRVEPVAVHIALLAEQRLVLEEDALHDLGGGSAHGAVSLRSADELRRRPRSIADRARDRQGAPHVIRARDPAGADSSVCARDLSGADSSVCARDLSGAGDRRRCRAGPAPC